MSFWAFFLRSIQYPLTIFGIMQAFVAILAAFGLCFCQAWADFFVVDIFIGTGATIKGSTIAQSENSRGIYPMQLPFDASDISEFNAAETQDALPADDDDSQSPPPDSFTVNLGAVCGQPDGTVLNFNTAFENYWLITNDAEPGVDLGGCKFTGVPPATC